MGFEEFWAAYPVKRAKLAALKAWNKLAPDEPTQQQILTAIEEQRRCKQWRQGYIPYPATWLNQGRWMDELGKHDFIRIPM